jgi:hypothetical protein
VPDPLVRPVESLMRGTGQRKKLRKIAKFYAKDVALLQQNIAECLGARVIVAVHKWGPCKFSCSYLHNCILAVTACEISLNETRY